MTMYNVDDAVTMVKGLQKSLELTCEQLDNVLETQKVDVLKVREILLSTDLDSEKRIERAVNLLDVILHGMPKYFQ
jgi:hypothetical protein